tara:strand:+ start:78 stop:422 length:345 start_codon:yes stop_codon:yes gene_type:complete
MKMKNETAIRMVDRFTSGDVKEDVVAKIFACEDIIEYDVLDWVKAPIDVLLQQFIEYASKTAMDFISNSSDDLSPDELSGELHGLRVRMESTMLAMVKYAAIYNIISEKIESER